MQYRLLVPILVILSGFVVTSVLPTEAYSQGRKKKERRAPPKTRKADTWSEQVGKQMLKVQEYFEKDDYPGAKALLTKLDNRRKLKPFEKAKINQFLGYVEYELGDRKIKRVSPEKLLALRNALTNSATRSAGGRPRRPRPGDRGGRRLQNHGGHVMFRRHLDGDRRSQRLPH